jgi:hypothetical protein
MNRRNGLSQVLKQLKLYAAVFAAQDSAIVKGSELGLGNESNHTK